MSESLPFPPQNLCDLLALSADQYAQISPGSALHEAVLQHLSHLAQGVSALGDLLECCDDQVLALNTRASVGLLLQSLGDVMGGLLVLLAMR